MEELNIFNLNNKFQNSDHSGNTTFYEWKAGEFRRPMAKMEGPTYSSSKQNTPNMA